MIEHEAVKESAVVPSPDSDRGQVVKAFVVLSDKYKHLRGDEEKENELKGKTMITLELLLIATLSCCVEELQKHVILLSNIYKFPRKITFVDSLPKTVSGKIKRIELKSKEFKSV